MLAHFSPMALLGGDKELPVHIASKSSPPHIKKSRSEPVYRQYERPGVKREVLESCDHLVNLRREKGSDYLNEQYSIIVQHFVACCTAPDRRRRAYSAVCGVCRERSRLHVCLLCVHLACHSPTRSHILAHAISANHQLAVELSYGQVLCAVCNDYVYDSEFGAIFHQFNNRARSDLGLPALVIPWEPSEGDIELLKQHPKRRKLSSHLTIGLRGLLNLGNTCFMNSILQALVHTPFIRDFFLSEQHHCVADAVNGCLGCEVRTIFREFYTGMQKPYIPYRLLHLVWKHAKHLSGYEQRDAHEFFISLLDILHNHLTRNGNKVDSTHVIHSNSSISSSGGPPSQTPHQCPCIIHKVFTGFMQSDVTCHKCGSPRTTIDPFWDISLDLHMSPSSNGLTVASGSCLSLTDCVQRFTRPEKLTGAKIECTVCRTVQEDLWSKQLTFKQLPLVVCFHLKRFHGTTNGSHRKISDAVTFPTDIDLTPFSTKVAAGATQTCPNYDNEVSVTENNASGMNAENSNNSNANNNASFVTISPAAEALRADSSSYALFAVVSHAGGQIDNGHYVAYVRQNNDWFKCDDHLVTPVTITDVLRAEGYLLFYHKKFVDYELPGIKQE